jgi:hypothetical protein
VIAPVLERISDPLERIFGILDGYRRGLLYTVFTGGCPIGNLGIEVGDHIPAARERIAANFQSWCEWVRKCLDDAGDRLPPGLDREQLAQFVLTVMEGAVMQARAHASIAPFDASVQQLRHYFGFLARSGAAPHSTGEISPS